MCDAIRIAHPQIASDAKKFFFFFFFASDAKTYSLDLRSQENASKKACENPAMLACDAKNRGVFKDRAMRNACGSDSRCGLACDASARDAKSLAIRVERCEPLRTLLCNSNGLLCKFGRVGLELAEDGNHAGPQAWGRDDCKSKPALTAVLREFSLTINFRKRLMKWWTC